MRGTAGIIAALVLAVYTSEQGPTVAIAAESDPSASAKCVVNSESETVVVLICPPGMDERSLGEAGKRACGPRTYCNAWIWDDRSKAPPTAPAKDADIQKQIAASAIAVWANDSKSLLLLRRTKQ